MRPALPRPGLRSLCGLLMLVLNAPAPEFERGPVAFAETPASEEESCEQIARLVPARRTDLTGVPADGSQTGRLGPPLPRDASFPVLPAAGGPGDDTHCRWRHGR